MPTNKLSTTHTLLASAILLMIGAMACPNTPWDSGDPANEMERMHGGVQHDQANVVTSLEPLNVLVRLADGNPAAGVSLRIRESEREAGIGSGLSVSRDSVLYESITGADGRCVATIRLPASPAEFAIEWSTPYAAQDAGRSAQESWKCAARTIVQRNELAKLELSLAHP